MLFRSTAKERYDRKVTELYYTVRAFLTAGLLKGLNEKQIQEFCAREYDDKGKRVVLDKKDDFKKKLGHSPDRADAACLVCEKAKRLGALATGNAEKRSNKSFEKLAREIAVESDFSESSFELDIVTQEAW